jgi:hypothetical protein
LRIIPGKKKGRAQREYDHVMSVRGVVAEALLDNVSRAASANPARSERIIHIIQQG